MVNLLYQLTNVSKLFECIVLNSLQSKSDFDHFQFGFKPGHSTSLCTNIFKQTVEYGITGRGAVMFSVVLWISTRRLIVLTTGSCFENTR